MKRRNFIGGLVAIPFIGELLAKQTLPAEVPAVDVKYDCGCYYDMPPCPPGLRCSEQVLLPPVGYEFIIFNDVSMVRITKEEICQNRHNKNDFDTRKAIRKIKISHR